MREIIEAQFEEWLLEGSLDKLRRTFATESAEALLDGTLKDYVELYMGGIKGYSESSDEELLAELIDFHKDDEVEEWKDFINTVNHIYER